MAMERTGSSRHDHGFILARVKIDILDYPPFRDHRQRAQRVVQVMGDDGVEQWLIA
jgi:hypothetical protein